MAKYLLYGIFILLLMLTCISCKKEDKPKSEIKKMSTYQRDSLALDRMEKYKREKLVKDEEGKAIGNIMFGITEKEFEKQKDIFLKDVQQKDQNGISYGYSLGGYEFYFLRGQFYEKKLYGVNIIGNSIGYSSYDAIMPLQKDIIDKIFIAKFGEPKFNYPLQSWHKLKSNSQYQSAQWVIGKKLISTSISSTGTHYSYDVSIFLPEVNGKIQEEERTKSDLSVEKAIDKI